MGWVFKAESDETNGTRRKQGVTTLASRRIQSTKAQTAATSPYFDDSFESTRTPVCNVLSASVGSRARLAVVLSTN